MLEKTRNAERNVALIHTIWCTGVRKFEIAAALWEKLDLETRWLWVLTKADDRKPRGWELKRISPTAAKALARWQPLSNPKDPRIFELSEEGISSIFNRASVKLGFPICCQDLRRGIGSYFAENGVSDRLAMKQLGIKTHAVYLLYSEGARLQALDEHWGDDE